MSDRPSSEPPLQGGDSVQVQATRVSLAIIPQSVFLLGALAIGYVIGVPPFATATVTWAAVGQGLLCALAMALAMSSLEWLAPDITRQVARSSVHLMRQAGITLSWPAIIVIAIAAGVGEEALFRGLLQSWASLHLPAALAVLLPAILFTVLHFYSWLYLILVFGIALFLGVAYAVTDNILVVIIAHAAYDVYGLYGVRRAMARGIGVG